MNRRIHRVLGAVVAAQMFVWLVTGLLFNIKHRYAEAYEELAAPPPLVASLTATPLDEARARTLAAAALERSSHRARYGAITTARLDGTTWELAVATGQRLHVDAATGAIAHDGPLNTWIDWTYRAHYMQYTPWKRVNLVVVVAWVAFTAFLLGTGLCLLWRGRSRAPARTLPE